MCHLPPDLYFYFSYLLYIISIHEGIFAYSLVKMIADSPVGRLARKYGAESLTKMNYLLKIPSTAS